MAKFLILQSPNKGNVGTITERSEDFYKPTFYKISESELSEFVAMSAHAKSAFISEKLELQTSTPEPVKKKIVEVVEVVGSQVELESVSMPEEAEEELNEPINIVSKPKGRPRKNK